MSELTIHRNDWSPRVWWGERDGRQVTYDFPTKALLKEAIEGGYAEVREGHRLVTSPRRLGTRRVAGFNTASLGTNAFCTCGGWRAFTNNASPSAGGERDMTERWLADHMATLDEREEA